jgi:hypothetical protein
VTGQLGAHGAIDIGAAAVMSWLAFQPEEALGIGAANLFAGVVVDGGVVEPVRGLVHGLEWVVHRVQHAVFADLGDGRVERLGAEEAAGGYVQVFPQVIRE